MTLLTGSAWWFWLRRKEDQLPSRSRIVKNSLQLSCNLLYIIIMSERKGWIRRKGVRVIITDASSISKSCKYEIQDAGS